ncbi:MAG: helix-turn-helix transcriptional regulator [Rhodospirillales bacterium]|jgi:transcriptional regulator with XRE-family HTH domain|nr:helix-turn-helix transcriptional regulator [Rhodospirillales bacterium]
MNKLEIIIGRNVRTLRKQKRWTQSKLANSIGMSLDMIGRIERGQAAPSIATVDKLAIVFDSKPIVLLTESPILVESTPSRKKHYEHLYSLLSDIDDDVLEWVLGIVSAAIETPGQPHKT